MLTNKNITDPQKRNVQARALVKLRYHKTRRTFSTRYFIYAIQVGFWSFASVWYDVDNDKIIKIEVI